MIPSRFLQPTSLSPAAALHVWLAIFAASLGPPVALAMPIARDFAHEPRVPIFLAVFSVAAVELLVLIAMRRSSPRRAALASLLAVPFAIVVCAMGGGLVAALPGFFLGGAFGILVATPVGFLFATLLAPLFRLAKRAEQSHALVLRDRVHAIAALYASAGSGIALLLGQPVWFAVPAILSLGFAVERVCLARARDRWLQRALAGEFPGYAVAAIELSDDQHGELAVLDEGPQHSRRVLFVEEAPDAALGAYRSQRVQRPLLRLS